MSRGVDNEAFQSDLSSYQSENNQRPYERNFVKSSTSQGKFNCGDDDKSKERTDAKPLTYLQLFRYATNYERRLIVGAVAFAFGSGMCFPFFLMLFGEFNSLLVDRNMKDITSSFSPVHSWYGGGKILKNGTHDERMAALLDDSVAFAIGTFTICFAEFVLGIAAVTCANQASMTQVSRVRMMFLRALMSQEMSWHDTHGTANVATRLADDLEKLQDGIGEAVPIVVFLVVSLISAIIVSFIEGWKLTLVILCCAPIILIAQLVVAKMQGALTLQECESYGSASSVVQEVLDAIRTVVAFGGEKKEIERYTGKLEESSRLGLKRGIYLGIGAGTTWLAIFIARAVTFWYGVNLILGDRYLDVADREYTPGICLVVMFGILTSTMNIGIAAPRFEALNVARGAAGAVFAVIERQSKINCFSSEDGQQNQELNGDIVFDNVHFQYPSRPEVPVLQALTLKIPSGQTVAIVGQSGSGKSTVMQLIQRLYDPEQGKVLVDGVDVRCLNVAWLRSQIGVVSQEPVLFDATIEENIRYGEPNAADGEIRQAAVDANAHEFIRKLPQGYQTMVGERGAQLSGGQKQRIAIARALVRRPAILLLDEATSALDRTSEAQVQAALDAASRGRTTLIVAHRLSTVRAADRIVVLSEGRLVEQGTHDELMAAKGHYHDLVSVEANNMDNTTPMIIRYPAMESVTEIQNVPSIASGRSENSIYQAEEYTSPLGRILALNAPDWPYTIVGCISAVVIGVCIPAHVVLIGSVYGVLSLEDPEDVRSVAHFYCILFVVVGVLIGIGTFLQSYTFTVAGVRLTNRLRASAFAAILRQEVGWFDEERNSVGALCARLAGDAASVQGVTRSCVAILQSSTTVIVGMIISFYLSWKLTLVGIISIPITFGFVILEHTLIKKYAVAEKHALEGATRVAVEAVSQFRTVASLGAELAVLQRYQRELDQVLAAGRKRIMLRGVVFAAETALPFICYALVYWFGSVLIITEDLPYQNVIITGDALIFGVWILGQFVAHSPNFTSAKLSAGRVFSLIDQEPRIKGASDNKDPNDSESLMGNIKYSSVEFSYPSRPEAKVLRGLDLLVRPGQTVALVGASGCGKSTCIQLLQRFYDPDAGQIRLGEQSIIAVPLRQLRRELGIVSQEPVLFDRTIAENIAYGDNERTPDITEIISMAKRANIHAFVSSLPLGYNTRLGAKGAQLSGGQKQRIAIARALLRNPRLLLLDEATSALDSQSERVVQAALEQAREGRTCITIAHRLATIQNADLICVLDRGVVAEAGTHSELMQMGGLYRRLQQHAEGP